MDNLKIDYLVVPSSLYRDSVGTCCSDKLNNGIILEKDYLNAEYYKDCWAPANSDTNPYLTLNFNDVYVDKLIITTVGSHTFPSYDNKEPSIMDVYYKKGDSFSLLKERIELNRWKSKEIVIGKVTDSIKLCFQVISHYGYLTASITEISMYAAARKSLYIKDNTVYGMHSQIK